VRWFRRSKPPGVPAADLTPRTPQELLWQSLSDLFSEPGESHPGPDIGFEGLSGSEVVRVCEHLSARTAIVGSEPTMWDRDEEVVRDAKPSLADAFALFARGELGYIGVSLDGVRAMGLSLPWLYLELRPGVVSMYWWVGTDLWDAECVAGLAVLLGEVHDLVPHAHVFYEWADTGEVGDFWGPVKRYVATARACSHAGSVEE
jgi:hypothetical protein